MYDKYILELVEVIDNIISQDNLYCLIRSFRLLIDLRIIRNRNY